MNKIQISCSPMSEKINGHGQAKILSDGELMEFFIYTPQPYKTIFAICLYTGCRVSEALALEKKYIGRDVIVLPKGITKGKTDTRTIDISPELKMFLDCYKPVRESIYMFPGKRGVRDTVSRSTAHLVLNQICSKIRVVGASTHSFRRTALTKMHNRGIPLAVIQEISGHASLADLQYYLSVTPEEKKIASYSLSFLG
jgi:integrase/recombinase XerD